MNLGGEGADPSLCHDKLNGRGDNLCANCDIKRSWSASCLLVRARRPSPGIRTLFDGGRHKKIKIFFRGA